MSEWDEDGDGSINFAEFLSAMTRILTDTDNEERMKEAFQLFDKVPCQFLSILSGRYVLDLREKCNLKRAPEHPLLVII